jgi:Cu+-exporting ATPase
MITAPNEAEMKNHGSAAKSHGGAPAPAATTGYTCPMHPEIRQNQPGSYPKCSRTMASKSLS